MSRCPFLFAVAALALGAGACGRSPSAPSSVAAPRAPGASIPGPAAGPMGQVSGVVADTEGHAIAGARLTSLFPGGDVDTVTDVNGEFSFTYALAGKPFVRVTAQGHEPSAAGWQASVEPVVLRISLQRIIFVEADSRVALSLTGEDKPYYVGEAYDSDYCSPCRPIRLLGAPKTATLHWSGADALQLWASDGSNVRRAQPDGERSQVVDLAGATIVYVGLPLGGDLRPQRLTATAPFEVSVQ